MLIHLNLEAVDAAIAAVNGALASGLDWQELEQMVKEERKAGNPVAGIIASMALERNKASSHANPPPFYHHTRVNTNTDARKEGNNYGGYTLSRGQKNRLDFVGCGVEILISFLLSEPITKRRGTQITSPYGFTCLRTGPR